MKKHSYIIGILFLFSTMTVSAQDFVSYFKGQDFSTIESMLSPDVTVKINGDTKVKGISNGLKAIRKTLNTFSPTRAESKHKGNSQKAGNDYLIAKLFNANGETLRLFIHLENADGGKRICDIKMKAS